MRVIRNTFCTISGGRKKGYILCDGGRTGTCPQLELGTGRKTVEFRRKCKEMEPVVVNECSHC